VAALQEFFAARIELAVEIRHEFERVVRQHALSLGRDRTQHLHSSDHSATPFKNR
jgi:hypothetical protein